MGKFTKQAYEEFTISADFSKNMALGETIVSQTVGALDVDLEDVSDVVIDQGTVANDGEHKAVCRVRAGEELKSPYKITFRVTTSSAHKWELDIQMRIKES